MVCFRYVTYFSSTSVCGLRDSSLNADCPKRKRRVPQDPGSRPSFQKLVSSLISRNSIVLLTCPVSFKQPSTSLGHAISYSGLKWELQAWKTILLRTDDLLYCFMLLKIHFPFAQGLWWWLLNTANMGIYQTTWRARGIFSAPTRWGGRCLW